MIRRTRNFLGGISQVSNRQIAGVDDPKRSHLAARIMGLDNGFSTYEDNATIYRF